MVKMSSKNNKNNEDGDDLIKGPWTASEDAMLIEQVKKCGERNWNLVPKNSELRRSSKSCKHRWFEHLRPDLNKGPFSEEEEKIIVDLHAKHGNKWALIATKLPGRSDNGIKNFWKVRTRKRQRECLPEYPPQMLQQAQHFSSSASSSLFNFSSVEPPPNISAANPPPNHNHKQPNQNSSSSSFSYSNNNASFVLPLTPMSSYYRSSSSSFPHCKSSGLLNDVVMEGNALCRKRKSKIYATTVIVREEEELADKTKIIEEPPVGTSKEEETATIIATQSSTDPSSSHQLISTEKNDNKKEKVALNNCMPQMDDELLSMLKNYPLYSPVHKWYKVDDDEDFPDHDVDGDWNLDNIWNIDGW